MNPSFFTREHELAHCWNARNGIGIRTCVQVAAQRVITACHSLDVFPPNIKSPCFFDGSGHIRCLASDASENSTSDAPEIVKSGFSDFRKSGFSEIRKSGNLKIRIFGFFEIWIFGNPTSEIPEPPELLISGYSDFPDFGNIGKSENPVKGIGCRICLIMWNFP